MPEARESTHTQRLPGQCGERARRASQRAARLALTQAETVQRCEYLGQSVDRVRVGRASRDDQPAAMHGASVWSLRSTARRVAAGSSAPNARPVGHRSRSSLRPRGRRGPPLGYRPPSDRAHSRDTAARGPRAPSARADLGLADAVFEDAAEAMECNPIHAPRALDAWLSASGSGSVAGPHCYPEPCRV